MCVMKRYRKYDPNTVEAVQFTGENGEEIINLLNVRGGTWITRRRTFDKDVGEEVHEKVLTLEIIDRNGRCRAFQGDYILREMNGDIYPVDEKSFLTSFEEIQ